MMPNFPVPSSVRPNPFPKDTYKHDFIEWWNIAVSRNRGNTCTLGEVLAEAAEAAHCAGTYGPPPKEGEDHGD